MKKLLTLFLILLPLSVAADVTFRHTNGGPVPGISYESTEYFCKDFGAGSYGTTPVYTLAWPGEELVSSADDWPDQAHSCRIRHCAIVITTGERVCSDFSNEVAFTTENGAVIDPLPQAPASLTVQ